MNRITLNFWLFFAVTTLSSGLLGRYLAALLKDYVTPGIVLMTQLFTAVTAFSVTVLLRIVKAVSDAKRQAMFASAYHPHITERSRL